MQLPTTNIRWVFTVAIVGGLGLNLLNVGGLRCAAHDPHVGRLLLALFSGLLIGLVCVLALKFRLSRFVRALSNALVRLGSTISTPAPCLWADELASMHDMLMTALMHHAAIPAEDFQ